MFGDAENELKSKMDIKEKSISILKTAGKFLLWILSLIVFASIFANLKNPAWITGIFISSLIIFPPFSDFLTAKNIKLNWILKLLIFLAGFCIAGSYQTTEEKIELEKQSKLQQIQDSKEKALKEKEEKLKAEQEKAELDQLQKLEIQKAKARRELAFKTGKQKRLLIAQTIRNNYLDKGLDIKVHVYGKYNENLKLTYPLFNDVWSHKMGKGSDVLSACDEGFKKFEMSDGHNWGYEWTCN